MELSVEIVLLLGLGLLWLGVVSFYLQNITYRAMLKVPLEKYVLVLVQKVIGHFPQKFRELDDAEEV